MTDKMLGGVTSPLPEAYGGTNAPTFDGARANMGLSTAQNNQTANYQAIAGDRGKLVRFSGAGPYTFTLIAAATLGDGWIVYARNDTAADLTIDTLGAETIDGAASITLEAGQAVLIFCNGTNFYSLGFYGVSPSGALLIVNNLSDLASVPTARANLGDSQVVNAQTLGYTALAADRGKVIRYTGAGAVTLSLTAAATLADGWYTILRNDSSGDITIDPAGAETINGAATVTINAGQGVIIYTNGTLFYTVGYYGSAPGGALLIVNNLSDLSNVVTARQNLAISNSYNAQTLAYTALAADRSKVIYYTGAGGVTLSLTAAATLGDGWYCTLRNSSSGTITIDPNGAETINGAATLAVAAGQSVVINCNGSLFTTTGEAATAASSAQFLTLATDGTLPNERVFTPGGGLAGVDGGAGSTYTLNSTRVVNAQTAGYTAIASDRGKVIRYTGAGGVTLALTAAATLTDGWFTTLRNDSSGVITIDPSGAETINGAATLAVSAGQAVEIYCNGTLFYTLGDAVTQAPATAQFLTLATDTTLTNERLFTPGGGLAGVDAGAGSTYTLNESHVANAQTAGYTALAADRGKVIRYTGAGGVTLTLTAAATLGDGWSTVLRNDSSGTITIDPNGAETINGAATLAVSAGNSVIVYCNGTLFYTVGAATMVGSSSITTYCQFDATSGAPVIQGSLNVASFVDNGVGDFTMNFTSSYATNDYAVGGCSGSASPGAFGYHIAITALATSSVRLKSGTSGGGVDLPWNTVMITGG